MAKTPSKKKVTAKSPQRTSSTFSEHKEAAASPFAGQVVNRPANLSGSVGFTPPGFALPPMGYPIQGAPLAPQQAGLPPMMSPPGIPAPMGSATNLENLGTMLRLGINALNTAIAGGTQLLQGITGSGYDSAHHHHGYYHHAPPHGGCCHDVHHCSCGHSCCNCYDAGCCHTGVHGCC